VAIEGFIRDNTRRKQAEDELERSRKNALIGSYIVQNGKFKYVNPEFCRIIKYSKDELINTDSIQYVHPDFVDHVRSNSRQMVKGQRWTPYEFCIIDKEGEVRWVMETVTSVLHEGRRAVLAFFMDITGAKQAEEGRREKEKLQAILELAGAVGHELNNPLQVILLCSANLERHVGDDPDAIKRLRMLKENTQRMIEITKKFRKITQYATKDYVRGKKILDIDAASGE
jgi:PAS domain S-box-containing protein